MNYYTAMKECISAPYCHTEQGGDYAIQWEGSTLKIFFEWSDGLIDWKNNLDFPARRSGPAGGFCHRGFLRVWKDVKPRLEAAIMDPRGKEIQIVGYSHGAAIALLCYEYCTLCREDCLVRGVGFGCPRVYWWLVKPNKKRLFRNFTVVRNGKDLVTHLPPALFGFRHVCTVLTVGVGPSRGQIDDHRASAYLRALRELNN